MGAHNSGTTLQVGINECTMVINFSNALSYRVIIREDQVSASISTLCIVLARTLKVSGRGLIHPNSIQYDQYVSNCISPLKWSDQAIEVNYKPLCVNAFGLFSGLSFYPYRHWQGLVATLLLFLRHINQETLILFRRLSHRNCLFFRSLYMKINDLKIRYEVIHIWFN